MTRLSFKSTRSFRDPRSGGPLRPGSVFVVISRGDKSRGLVCRQTIALVDNSTGDEMRVKVLEVKLLQLEAIGTEELSMHPAPNIGNPKQFINRLKATYGELLGSILTVIKVELVS